MYEARRQKLADMLPRDLEGIVTSYLPHFEGQLLWERVLDKSDHFCLDEKVLIIAHLHEMIDTQHDVTTSLPLKHERALGQMSWLPRRLFGKWHVSQCAGDIVFWNDTDGVTRRLENVVGVGETSNVQVLEDDSLVLFRLSLDPFEYRVPTQIKKTDLLQWLASDETGSHLQQMTHPQCQVPFFHLHSLKFSRALMFLDWPKDDQQSGFVYNVTSRMRIDVSRDIVGTRLSLVASDVGRDFVIASSSVVWLHEHAGGSRYRVTKRCFACGNSVITPQLNLVMSHSTGDIQCRSLRSWQILWQMRQPWPTFKMFFMSTLEAVVGVSKCGHVWTNNGLNIRLPYHEEHNALVVDVRENAQQLIIRMSGPTDDMLLCLT